MNFTQNIPLHLTIFQQFLLQYITDDDSEPILGQLFAEPSTPSALPGGPLPRGADDEYFLPPPPPPLPARAGHHKGSGHHHPGCGGDRGALHNSRIPDRKDPDSVCCAVDLF